MEPRVSVFVDGLDSRGVIHVSYRRQFRSLELELLYTEKLLLFRGKREAQFLPDGRHDEHVWARSLLLEVVPDLLGQHRRSKRAKRLPIFDLQVHDGLHLRAARIADDRAPPQRARAELHATLKPSDHVLVLEQLRKARIQGGVIEFLVLGTKGVELCLDLITRVPRTEIRAAHEIMPVHCAWLLFVFVPRRCRGADSAPGISSCGLDPDVIEWPFAENPAVCDAVQRHTTCEAEVSFPGLAVQGTREPQDDFFRDELYRGCDV